MYEHVVSGKALKVKVVCGLNDLPVQVKFHGVGRVAVPENIIGFFFLLRYNWLFEINKMYVNKRAEDLRNK
mgnify:CR=1 FL=1